MAAPSVSNINVYDLEPQVIEDLPFNAFYEAEAFGGSGLEAEGDVSSYHIALMWKQPSWSSPRDTRLARWWMPDGRRQVADRPAKKQLSKLRQNAIVQPVQPRESALVIFRHQLIEEALYSSVIREVEKT